MPRPARAIWVPRAYARRRHRSWMLAMTLASLGWGAWWLALFLWKLEAPWVPSVGATGTVSTVFAVVGLMVALLTVRKGRSWLLFAAVPLLANGSLLLVPWLAAELAPLHP